MLCLQPGPLDNHYKKLRIAVDCFGSETMQAKKVDEMCAASLVRVSPLRTPGKCLTLFLVQDTSLAVLKHAPDHAM